MVNADEALTDFVLALANRQAAFFGPFIVLFLLANGAFPGSAVLAVLLLACGALAVLVDLWCFALVPTYFTTEEAGQAARVAAVGVGVLVGFLAFTSVASPGGFLTHLLLCLGLKLAVPVVFGLCAFASFRDDVHPLWLKLGPTDPELARVLGEQAATRSAELRQRRHREAAVNDARRRVLLFFNQHRAQLSQRFHPSWLEAEVPARIPETATGQEAYRAASDLLAQLTGFLRERQEKLDAVDTQLQALAAARRSFTGNTTLDPELLRDELAELERREHELQAQRAGLARAA